MKTTYSPVKTNRGWELADQDGGLEAEAISIVYATKALARAAAKVEVDYETSICSREGNQMGGDNYTTN